MPGENTEFNCSVDPESAMGTCRDSVIVEFQTISLGKQKQKKKGLTRRYNGYQE